MSHARIYDAMGQSRGSMKSEKYKGASISQGSVIHKLGDWVMLGLKYIGEAYRYAPLG